MGQLVNGVWTQLDIRQGDKNDKGEFIRKPMSFRGNISENSEHPPESGRYHLYVSYACPWAHRTLIMRSLKSLKSHISVSFVSPDMLGDGWSFQKDFDEIPDDPIHHHKYLKDLYTQVDPQFTGRVTVPVLYDKKLKTIINNESSEIIRIFNESFNDLTGNQLDYYPQKHQSSIEQWNDEIYHNINNGVYKCGFARSQEAYEKNYRALFETLDRVDQQLQRGQWLCGESLTEADVRLFPTVVRFDAVYHTHFKCNGRLISQYPGLSRFLGDFMKLNGVEETINMNHIKRHYYYSHNEINPTRIVPLGPIDSGL